METEKKPQKYRSWQEALSAMITLSGLERKQLAAAYYGLSVKDAHKRIDDLCSTEGKRVLKPQQIIEFTKICGRSELLDYFCDQAGYFRPRLKTAENAILENKDEAVISFNRAAKAVRAHDIALYKQQ